jgi:hypothetical protein
VVRGRKGTRQGKKSSVPIEMLPFERSRDLQNPRNFGNGVVVCRHCGTGEGFIEQVWTDDGAKPLLCENCRAAVRSLESMADKLAAVLGCPERQQILEETETTAALVRRLCAHDLAGCAACALLRRGIGLHSSQTGVIDVMAAESGPEGDRL